MNEDVNKTVETTEEVAVVVEKKERKKRVVTPEAELKKQLKAAKHENETLAAQLEQAKLCIEGCRRQMQEMDATINRLSMNYQRVTDYVKESTSVFHRSLLMALDKEVM